MAEIDFEPKKYTIFFVYGLIVLFLKVEGLIITYYLGHTSKCMK